MQPTGSHSCFEIQTRRRTDERRNAMMLEKLFLEAELRSVRSAELEKRLEVARQIRAARPDQPGLREWMLRHVGDALVALGERLRSRDVPLDECAGEAECVEPEPISA
jgi:hypothetical protein